MNKQVSELLVTHAIKDAGCAAAVARLLAFASLVDLDAAGTDENVLAVWSVGEALKHDNPYFLDEKMLDRACIAEQELNDQFQNDPEHLLDWDRNQSFIAMNALSAVYTNMCCRNLHALLFTKDKHGGTIERNRSKKKYAQDCADILAGMLDEILIKNGAWLKCPDKRPDTRPDGEQRVLFGRDYDEVRDVVLELFKDENDEILDAHDKHLSDVAAMVNNMILTIERIALSRDVILPFINWPEAKKNLIQACRELEIIKE